MRLTLRLLVLGFAMLLCVNQGQTASFRWLGELRTMPVGDYSTRSQDVSDDGSVVVGGGSVYGDGFALRWTKSYGIGGLPFPGQAYGISGDGSAIVGGIFHGEEVGYGAFLWTQSGGIVDL